MAAQKTLYEDVVVAGELPKRSKPAKKQQRGVAKSSGATKASGEKNKKNGKDEKPHAAMEKRAEKLAEDPYITPAEMKNMDGGTKEKEKETEETDSALSPQEQSKKDLDIIASRAEKILFRAKTVFPFDFFPDTVTIDANKVDICLKSFFATETVTSIMLKEIMDVRVNIALFLATLIIDYGPHPLKIKSVFVSQLLKKDALKAKEIIEGVLVLYRGENIDTSKLKPEEAMEGIKEVGRIEEP